MKRKKQNRMLKVKKKSSVNVMKENFLQEKKH